MPPSVSLQTATYSCMTTNNIDLLQQILESPQDFINRAVVFLFYQRY